MAKRGMGCGIALGAAGIFLLIVIIGAAASGGSSSTPDDAPSVLGNTAPSNTDATEDVRVDSCQVETNVIGTQAKIRVTITNHTNQAQSYFVTVAINDQGGGTRYGEATAVTSSLGAGQTTVLDAVGFPGKPPGAFVCTVANVARLPV